MDKISAHLNRNLIFKNKDPNLNNLILTVHIEYLVKINQIKMLIQFQDQSQ